MLTKLQVSPGVFWVEVPEAGLSVLCGCPADSVKHLVKRGLIAEREKLGYPYETGPNAILLSDVLVQNGAFSNLAEFPVLQMLYRQGMIIPGHPNNTGQKPLLIGSKAQISAQMQYIYRGNYGLASEEELIQAGVEPAEAHELMRMKLKFAFGRIRNTDELLNSVTVENEPVEIRKGVSIQRLRMNVFEFRYKDHAVLVDLNLPPATFYESPYFLGFHDIKREYFAVVHSGDGDGWDPRRPAMASVLFFQGKVYLIDAGPNILSSLKALGIGVNEVEGIFHTHAHDDHFCGLPALMQADHRIKYYSTALVRASVVKKLSALVSISDEDFFNYFEVCDLQPDTWNDIEGLEVKPLFSPHPVETCIFVFRAMRQEGFKSYAHFADISSFEVLREMVTGGTSLPGISREMYNTVTKAYTEKTDLKKIDVGGGMIHGNAEDFKADGSTKIILSHTSRDLTLRQKQIGSGAPFGMVDTLIPASQDYFRVYAFNYLESYFPSVPRHQLRLLANNPLRFFNPQSILLKAGASCESIYLILSGEVELVDTEAGVCNALSSGTLIGEMSALMGLPLAETFVAATFVSALEVPTSLYRYFTDKNGLTEELSRLHQKRDFFQKTWLFGDSISSPVQTLLARAVRESEYNAGQDITVPDYSDLHMIWKGRVQLHIEDEVLETLRSGDFIGEQHLLFGIPPLFGMRAVEDTLMYRIPGELLLQIPIVRWKLLEAHRKRMEMVFHPQLSSLPVFQWRQEYRTNVAKLDREHQELFDKANSFYAGLAAGGDPATIKQALTFLIAYADTHFKDEEKLMQECSYPEYEHHRKLHKKFLKQVLEMEGGHNQGSPNGNLDLVNFLRDWIIHHILTADRKYGPFFNEKGIF